MLKPDPVHHRKITRWRLRGIRPSTIYAPTYLIQEDQCLVVLERSPATDDVVRVGGGAVMLTEEVAESVPTEALADTLRFGEEGDGRGHLDGRVAHLGGHPADEIDEVGPRTTAVDLVDELQKLDGGVAGGAVLRGLVDGLHGVAVAHPEVEKTIVLELGVRVEGGLVVDAAIGIVEPNIRQVLLLEFNLGIAFLVFAHGGDVHFVGTVGELEVLTVLMAPLVLFVNRATREREDQRFGTLHHGGGSIHVGHDFVFH